MGCCIIGLRIGMQDLIHSVISTLKNLSYYSFQGLESLCRYGHLWYYTNKNWTAFVSTCQTLNSWHRHCLLQKSFHLVLCILNASEPLIPSYDPPTYRGKSECIFCLETLQTMIYFILLKKLVIMKVL